MNTQEEWKPVSGFERYHISNHGDIKNVETNTLLKIRIDHKKRSLIQVTVSYVKKTLPVGKTVAQHFIDNPNNYQFIKHKDGNPQNNHVDNLEWSIGPKNSANFSNKPILSRKDIKYKGVYFRENRNCWGVQMRIGGKVARLSLHLKLKDAVEAADAKFIEIYGENAITNKKLIEIGARPPIPNGFDVTIPENEDLPGELWKNIPDKPNKYMASNMGRIKIFSNEEKGYLSGFKISDPSKNKKGYFMVTFKNGDKTVSYLLHRLIAKTFIPNPDNLPQVNHKNLIKTDNRVENLEWITNYDNMQHAIQNGVFIRDDSDKRRKLKHSEAQDILLDHKSGKSVEDLTICYNVSEVTINNLLRGKTYKSLRP